MSANDIWKNLKVGDRIKAIRSEKKITQRYVATKLEIPFSTYSNYENGNRTPSYRTLQKIAEILEVSVGELVGGDEEQLVAEIAKDVFNKIAAEKERKRPHNIRISSFLASYPELISYLKSIGFGLRVDEFNSLLFEDKANDIGRHVTVDNLISVCEKIEAQVRNSLTEEITGYLETEEWEVQQKDIIDTNIGSDD